MKIRIKVNEDTYYIKLLYILNKIPPFNKLRPQELELYAHLLTVNHKYRSIPFKERNKLIFNYDTRLDISNKMGIKLTGVYNIMSILKNAGVIEQDSLIPKYVLNKSEEVTFIFEDEDHN